MQRECGSCGSSVPEGAIFCPSCGHRLNQYSNDTPSARGTIGIIAASIGTILLTVAVVFIIVYFPEVFGSLTELGQLLFIGCAAVFVLCAAYVIRRACVTAREGMDGLGRSGWAGCGRGLAVLMVFSYTYVMVTVLLGVNIDSSGLSGYTEYQLAALLFMAGPREEIVYRLLPIGIPMVILYAISRKKGSLACVMGGFGATKAAWILIIISAALFGMAHLEGWNTVKVPQAFISGLIFGYLYAEYGLYASVLVHAGLDLMGVGANMVPALTVLGILALCALGLILVIIELASGEVSKKKPTGSWLGDDVPEKFLDRWNRHRSLAEELPQSLL